MLAVRAPSPSGCEPEILRSLAQQQIDRRERNEDQQAQRPAGGAPAGLFDQRLRPRKQRDRADAHTGKGDADREPPLAHEPVRQEQRLAGIAKAHAAGADQHADRQVQMPRFAGQRREQEACRHHYHAQLHHGARSRAVHQAAHQRAEDRRDHEAERKGAGRHAALPAELIDDRCEQERERRARIHADPHRHEGDRDDDPAVEEGEAHGGLSDRHCSSTLPPAKRLGGWLE